MKQEKGVEYNKIMKSKDSAEVYSISTFKKLPVLNGPGLI